MNAIRQMLIGISNFSDVFAKPRQYTDLRARRICRADRTHRSSSQITSHMHVAVSLSNRSVQAQHEAMDGSRTHLAVHDTNSPILPVSQMAELHKFRPELVDWVLAETERRERWEETRIWRTDRFIFLERILGQLGGILIAIVGLASATVMALNGHDWAAGTVGSGTLLGIVIVIASYR